MAKAGRMEIFGARPEEPQEACLREIDTCDMFVGIYAHRYGYIPPGSEQSITKSEFRHAKNSGKPIFCFVIDEDYPWPPPMIEDEPGRTKLRALKAEIGTDLVRETFTSAEDLALKIATSVGRYITDPACSRRIYSRRIATTNFWHDSPVDCTSKLFDNTCWLS